jgi:hypothetical protein
MYPTSSSNKVENSGLKYKEYFNDKENWKQKEQFLRSIESLFDRFNNKKDLYFVLENPDLDFSLDICMKRPFDIFYTKSVCGLKYGSYMKRFKEYRDYIYKVSKKYKDVTIFDPEDLYCDEEYCYAIRYGTLLYRDDDHHSIDGSKVQAKYFLNNI